MSIVYETSFDHYTTGSQRWGLTSGNQSIGAFGRNGTNGVRFINDNVGNGYVVTLASGTFTALNAAFAHRFANVANGLAVRAISDFRDAGAIQLWLALAVDGQLRVYRAGSADTSHSTASSTLLATSTGIALLVNTYYHIEWEIAIANAGGTVKVWVNEQLRINSSGLDTQATSNGFCNQFGIYASTSGTPITVNTDFDDVVVATSRIMDVEVGAFLPTGTGSTNMWTPTGAATSKEAVDETTPNDDTDYISTTGVSNTSLFTFGTIPTTTEILAVIPIPRASKTDGGTATIASAVRHSGTTYNGAVKAPSNSTYEYFPDILNTNPGTGVTWTAADWNAIEVGVHRNS